MGLLNFKSQTPFGFQILHFIVPVFVSKYNIYDEIQDGRRKIDQEYFFNFAFTFQ